MTAVAAAALVACGGAGSPRPAGDARLDAGPYILLGPPGVAYIAFVADGLEDPPLVEWSDESGRAGGKTALRADDVWYVELEGLPAGERIGYRVRTERGVGARHEFRVGPRPGEEFRFAIFGQTQKGHDVHRQIAAAVQQQRIEFVVHTGDMVDGPDERSQWLRFFAIEQSLLATTPVLAVPGENDDGERLLFRRYFLHRVWNDNRRYFARDFGKLRVVVVDFDAELTMGRPQYALVEAALEEGARTGKLLVLVVHQPPFSSAAHGWHDVREPIHALARRFGVELVVSGHAHNYERTKPIDGVTYVVTGVAGARSRALHEKRFSASASVMPHFVLVDVVGDRMTLRAIDVRGDTIDSHVIKAVPPAE